MVPDEDLVNNIPARKTSELSFWELRDAWSVRLSCSHPPALDFV